MKPYKKVSTSDGKLANLISLDDLFFLIGVIGSAILLYGVTQPSAQAYFVIGSACLLLTSIHFRLIYYIALEIILISGHGATLLGIGKILQLAIPSLLCIQLLFFYYMSNQLNNLFVLIGIMGIAILAIGFAFENQIVFFLGGFSIAFYSFYNVYQGLRVTLLWAILNSLFAIIAILKLILH